MPSQRSKKFGGSKFIKSDNRTSNIGHGNSGTAGGLFGHVGEFNSERETFQSYVERMGIYFFTANNIVETPG
jgi:hypothetical protein